MIAVNTTKPIATYLPGVPCDCFAFSMPLMLGSYGRESESEKPEFSLFRLIRYFGYLGRVY